MEDNWERMRGLEEEQEGWQGRKVAEGQDDKGENHAQSGRPRSDDVSNLAGK